MKSRCLNTRLFSAVFLVILISVCRAENGLYALVFGNDKYDSMSKLPSAAADAQKFASLLKNCGFSLPLGNDEQTGASLNLTREQMCAQIREFRSSGVPSKASIVVFYFAGHGGQANDEVYVLGTGALVERNHESTDLEKSGLSLRSIASDLKPKKGKGLITIVDACRLGQESRASSGVDDEDVLAVFSTSAGTKAKSGVFTPTLVAALERQQSWTEAISAARLAAQKEHGQQPRVSYDHTGPLASYSMTFKTPSPRLTLDLQPSIQLPRKYPSLVRLTNEVRETLTLHDSPSGKEIGRIFQNMDVKPFANCDPAGLVEKAGLSWLPVRCSGWVLKETAGNDEHNIKVELSQFTVLNRDDSASVKLRDLTNLEEKPVLDLLPGVTGTAIKWTTVERSIWYQVQVDGWVIVKSQEGRDYVTF